MKILTQGPWSFDKYLISLFKSKDNEFANDAMFLWTFFWIQIHNLPLGHMTKNNVEAIGKILGTVEPADVSPNGECRGHYIRVQVNIEIN